MRGAQGGSCRAQRTARAREAPARCVREDELEHEQHADDAREDQEELLVGAALPDAIRGRRTARRLLAERVLTAGSTS